MLEHELPLVTLRLHGTEIAPDKSNVHYIGPIKTYWKLQRHAYRIFGEDLRIYRFHFDFPGNEKQNHHDADAKFHNVHPDWCPHIITTPTWNNGHYYREENIEDGMIHLLVHISTRKWPYAQEPYMDPIAPVPIPTHLRAALGKVPYNPDDSDCEVIERPEGFESINRPKVLVKSEQTKGAALSEDPYDSDDCDCVVVEKPAKRPKLVNQSKTLVKYEQPKRASLGKDPYDSSSSDCVIIERPAKRSRIVNQPKVIVKTEQPESSVSSIEQPESNLPLIEQPESNVSPIEQPKSNVPAIEPSGCPPLELAQLVGNKFPAPGQASQTLIHKPGQVAVPLRKEMDGPIQTELKTAEPQRAKYLFDLSELDDDEDDTDDYLEQDNTTTLVGNGYSGQRLRATPLGTSLQTLQSAPSDYRMFIPFGLVQRVYRVPGSSRPPVSYRIDSIPQGLNFDTWQWDFKYAVENGVFPGKPIEDPLYLNRVHRVARRYKAHAIMIDNGYGVDAQKKCKPCMERSLPCRVYHPHMGFWKDCDSAQLNLLGFRCSFCRANQPRREDDGHGCGAHWTAHQALQDFSFLY